nr:immunoglobulin heavy chain junction region [Mus musculus]
SVQDGSTMILQGLLT